MNTDFHKLKNRILFKTIYSHRYKISCGLGMRLHVHPQNKNNYIIYLDIGLLIGIIIYLKNKSKNIHWMPEYSTNTCTVNRKRHNSLIASRRHFRLPFYTTINNFCRLYNKPNCRLYDKSEVQITKH